VSVTTERPGAAFELGEQLTVIGPLLVSGDRAPDFSLDSFDASTGAIRAVRLADTAGQVRLLHVVNSLDTPVCHVGAHRWETLRADLPPEVVVYTVSMDLPFAQSRWQVAEGVEHPALSAHRAEAFGQSYGVLIKEWRLLQRSVFVIGRDDRIVYAEYVADQMREPAYEAALIAARTAARA
jgi:thiol peroxidase